MWYCVKTRLFMAKKILLLCLVTLLAVAGCFSQTEKGDWLVGGNMTINTTSNNSAFTLQPNAGYFFANNFAAGADLALNFSKTGNVKTSAESAGPFARYYFNLHQSPFKPFVVAEYAIGNLVTRLPDSKSSNTFSNFFLGAGGAFFINSNVALEAVAGYNHSKVQGQDPQNGFVFKVGFQVHLLSAEVQKATGR